MRAGLLLLLGLIGPPASGKSTVSAALESAGTQTFRLQDFAEARRRDGFRNAPNVGLGVSEVTNDGTVDALLREAFLRGGFAVASPIVVVHGLPASTAQVAQLRSVARSRGGYFNVVELEAPDLTLYQRFLRRKGCPSCGADFTVAPPALAISQAGNFPRCARCSSPLAELNADAHAFLDRLHRYRRARERIRAAAADVGIPWASVDSSAPDPKVCLDGVRQAIALMTGVPSLLNAGTPQGVHTSSAYAAPSDYRRPTDVSPPGHGGPRNPPTPS